MARLIPKIAVQDISLKPERDVAHALVEQLPQDCIVYHSYPWLRADRNEKSGKTTLKEGEADFVVVYPALGLLIIEVKGGTVEYDAECHLWYRCPPNGYRYEIKDPFHQANDNMHCLVKEVVRHSFPGEECLPCAFGYAVVFPDCEYTGPMPPGAENSILLTTKDLPYLDRRIPDILKNWCRTSKPRPLSKNELDGVVKALSPAFQLLPVLFRSIEEQEELLFRLTQEQMRVLDILQKHKRAAVEGVAGSGKTMLAKAQAQRFADQDLKTLLVCYNRVLAEWLKTSLPGEYDGKITVSNFHRLCHEYCSNAGIKFITGSDLNEEFWKDRAPELFMQAIEKTDVRFDAIVVDEGQDFFPNWWIPLEMVSSEEEVPFYLFYDPAQNLFVGDNLAIPNLGTPVMLPTNCRNTSRIAKTCSRIKGVDIQARDDAPEGDETIVRVAARPDQQVKICEQIIGEWIHKGKLKPSQIAIQSPRSREKSPLANIEKLNGLPLVESVDKWNAGEGILFMTIRSFKGLEADAVIVIDVLPTDTLPHFTSADLYVACSRAKHLLAVLPRSEGIL
jgi:hypothetical protein